MTDRLADHPIVKAAGLRAGDSILEIGFRQVALMQTFAEIVGDQGQVTGVDIDLEHVAEAQAAIRENAWSNIQAMEGSILELPFRDGTFDAVLSVGILHEVRDLDRAFREVSRVIRPDGRVVIADFKRFSRIKFALYRARIRLRGKPSWISIPASCTGAWQRVWRQTGFPKTHIGFFLGNGQWDSSEVSRSS